MSATGVFTVGRDGNLVLSVSGYGNITPPLGTMFKSAPVYKKVRSEPLNSPPIEAELPDGWNWDMEADRSNRAVDDLVSAAEAGFWNGGTLPTCSVTQYVKENDGSISTYAFASGSLKIDTGSFDGDKVVKQKISGFSPTRRKVS